MTRSLRLLPLLALLLSAFVACVEIEHATTLNSDGSGKFALTMSIKTELLAMLPEEEDPFGGEYETPSYYETNSEGVVAWEIGEPFEEDEMTRYSVVGWFEDINEVVLKGNLSGSDMDGDTAVRELSEEERAGVSFAFATEDGVSTLQVENLGVGPLSELEEPLSSNDPDSMEYKMAEMMAEMMEGMLFEFSITLPGAVTQSQGFLEQDDRRVSIRIDDKLMVGLDLDEAQTKQREKLMSLKDVEATTASWNEVKIDPEELAQFRKELENAKAAWQKRLAETEETVESK